MHARRWFEWHSWIGLTTGLLLFVICWSGTIAVFSEEIDWLLNSAERVESRGDLRSFGEWADAVTRAYPDLRIDSIAAPRTSRSAAELLVETPDGRLLRTYVDPFTATVTGQTSYFNVQRFFRSLHMSLFDPGAKGIGYYVVMSFSFALVGSLLTSLVFYKRWWQRFLAWRAHPNRRAFWSDMHKLMGLWSLWFVALMAITGLWYLIEFPGWGFAYPELEPVPRTSTRAFLSTDALVARAQQVSPTLRITQMYTPGGYYGPVAVFHGEGQAALVRDRANVVVLDATSGAPLLVRPAEMLGWPARWVDTADPLHFGNFAGLAGKVVWFVFGAGLSALCLTGAYLHFQRQKRHANIVQRRRAVIAAYVTTCLVLLAAVIGAVREVSGYGGPQPPASVHAFIAIWTVTTVLVLLVWMRRLR